MKFLMQCALLLSGILLMSTAETQAADRPNFLLMIADDMTWSDLGYEGNPDIHTPHLDALRKQSMHLTQMFTPATTCSPSRHAIYTGLFSVRSGAYPNHTRVRQGTESVFTLLKDAGYRVALQNKSHVAPPESFPYEHIKGADDLTETKQFLSRDKDQPWLLSYCSNDPHSQWSRGPKDLYDPETLSVPSYLHDNQTTRELLAAYYAEITKFDEQVGNLLELLEESGQADNTLVMFVSEQGSSFPYGGKWSVYDNGIRVSTLIRWPGHVQAGSSSDALLQYVDVVPTFLDAAGIDPTTVDVHCPDAFGNTGFDGRSFLSVLTGDQTSFRDYVFSQHTTVGINGYQEPYPMRAVRDKRFKYIRNLAPQNTYSIGGIHKGEPIESWQADAKSNPALAKRVEWLFHRPAEELYDLKNDPLETNNLAGNSDLKEVQAKLSEELNAWMKQQGDEGMQTELEAVSRQSKVRQQKAKQQKGGKKKQGRKTNNK